MKTKYHWEYNDGVNRGASACVFDTEKEAYDSMREAVFARIREETEYDNGFKNADCLFHELDFGKNTITHISHSGDYVYKVEPYCNL